MKQLRKGHTENGARRKPILIDFPSHQGRPNTLGKDKRTINFTVPKAQAKAASKKSNRGRIFNVADYMRLLHKHLFVNVSLAQAQALHQRLVELDEGGSEDFNVAKWLEEALAGTD